MHVLLLNILAKSGYSSRLNIEKRAQYMEDVGACVHIQSRHVLAWEYKVLFEQLFDSYEYLVCWGKNTENVLTVQRWWDGGELSRWGIGGSWCRSADKAGAQLWDTRELACAQIRQCQRDNRHQQLEWKCSYQYLQMNRTALFKSLALSLLLSTLPKAEPKKNLTAKPITTTTVTTTTTTNI